MLINVPNFIFDELSNVTLCSINDVEIGFYVYLANLIISTIIPFFIMFLSTCIILHCLITQRRRLQRNNTNYRREKDFAKSVLSMDLWFLICYTPYCIFCFLRYTQVYNDVNNDDLWRLAFNSTAILAIVETSCNFFIYYFCNALFKEYFLSMICC